jgi:hypothetical protein
MKDGDISDEETMPVSISLAFICISAFPEGRRPLGRPRRR